MPANILPTKKQRELLGFIETFIGAHGYSPSYREIMTGLGYTSVSTVALHVSSLIARGHIRKRDRSARSLEVVKGASNAQNTLDVTPTQEKWLIDRVTKAFNEASDAKVRKEDPHTDHLYVLVGALKVLGLEEAARSFMPKLTELDDES